MSLQSFHYEHLGKCGNYWFNTKNCCLSQHKQKLYKKCENKKTKQPHVNISDTSESKRSIDSSASEDEIIN